MISRPASPVIITADDLGMSESVNQAILQCLIRGHVTHASLIVNLPATEAAVTLVKGAGVAEWVGLHLNLTLGEPLTDVMAGNARFCHTGKFRYPQRGRGMLPLTPRDRAALAAETRAQMQRFREHGLRPFALDSHHHLHMEPNLVGVILPIARDFGFERVRMPGHAGLSMGLLLPLKQAIGRRRIAAHGFPRVRFMEDLADARRMIDRQGAPSGPIEIVTHPDLNEAGEIVDGSTHERVVDRLAALHDATARAAAGR